MKNKLMIFALFLMFTSILLCGCPQKKENENKPAPTPTPSPNPPVPDVQSKIKIENVEIALINKSNKKEEFKKLRNFSVDNEGPYSAEEAETAYVTLQVTAKKPASSDYSISVVNTNTYEQTLSFDRDSADPQNLFVLGKNIALAKGKNNLELTVVSSDRTVSKKYKIVVNYDGGQDYSDPKANTPTKLIPGIYCPAQRKSIEGETEEDGKAEPFLWVISIAGSCSQCPYPLNSAGSKGEDIAQKFKNRGLRVVAMEDENAGNLFEPNLACNKWNDSGRGYNMYTSQNNCLYRHCKGSNVSYPNVHFIKENKKLGTQGPVNSYTSFIQEYFGLN